MAFRNNGSVGLQGGENWSLYDSPEVLEAVEAIDRALAIVAKRELVSGNEAADIFLDVRFTLGCLAIPATGVTTQEIPVVPGSPLPPPLS